MRKNLLRWFGHVHETLIDATMTRTDCVIVIFVSRERKI